MWNSNRYAMVRNLMAVLLAWTFSPHELFSEDFASEDFVFRIVSEFPDGSSSSLTGFKIRDSEGVYTSLHGVLGAKRVIAFLPDKSTRYELALSKVDIERDIAFLIAKEGNALPKGGLALGDWPDAEQVSEVWGKKDVQIVGYPLGVNLKAAFSPMKVRDGDAYTSLSNILNAETRSMLVNRKSPSTQALVLHLDGNLLPGHSGAPVLSSDYSLIAVGDGGLEEGKVGWSWAIPFHDVQLKAIDEPEVKELLAKIPPYTQSRTLFRVFEKSSTAKPQATVVNTFVDSADGEPVLGLTKLPDSPAGEQANAEEKLSSATSIESPVLIPTPTLVELLNESVSLSQSIDLKYQGKSYVYRKGERFSKVSLKLENDETSEVFVPTSSIKRETSERVFSPNNKGTIIAGDNYGLVVNGDVIINPPAKKRTAFVINNEGGAAMAYKEDLPDGIKGISDLANSLGNISKGTEVEVLPGEKVITPVFKLARVKFLSGKFKGKIGWVSERAIEEVEKEEK